MGTFRNRARRVVAAGLVCSLVSLGLMAGTASADAKPLSGEAPAPPQLPAGPTNPTEPGPRLGDRPSAPAAVEAPPAAVAPSNDDFANAINLPGTGFGTTTGSSVGATAEPGEPYTLFDADPSWPTVWWNYRAPGDGTLVVDTSGSNFDTFLAVFTGPTIDELTEIALNNDISGTDLDSRVTFPVSAGTTYRITVEGWQVSDSGDIVLNWQAAPPANDNLLQAVALTGASGTASGTNYGGTTEAGETPANDPSVWWHYTPAKSGVLTVDTLGSNFDTTLDVYSGGGTIAGLTLLGENDDIDFEDGLLWSRVAVNVSAGVDYKIRVNGFVYPTGPSIGLIQLNHNLQTAPAAPTAVTVTPSGPSASVAFTPGSNGGSAVTEFAALCTSSDGGASRSKTGAASPLVVPNLTVGKIYSCKVRATNAIGTGPYSVASASFVTTTSAPAAPTGVVVTPSGPSASVAFTPGSDGGSPVTSYLALCTSSDGGASRSKTGTGSPLAVPNLTIAKTYTCKVRATNAIGTGPYSASSASFVTSPAAPAAPTGVVVTPSGPSASVAFTPGSDGGSPVTSYFALCTSTDGGVSRSKTGTGSPLVVPSLSVVKTYTCKVRATNAIGTGPYSAASASFVTNPSAPTAPTGVVVSPTGTSALVAFAPGSDGGSPVTSFYALCTSSNGGTSRSKTGAGSPLAVPNLTTGKTYTCRVRATNAIGTGPYSAQSASFVV
jgi:hypothetical protein